MAPFFFSAQVRLRYPVTSLRKAIGGHGQVRQNIVLVRSGGRRRCLRWRVLLRSLCSGGPNRFAGEVRREEAQHIQEQVVLFSERLVPAGVPFHTLLEGLGFDAGNAARLISSAQSVFDLRHLRAGNRLAWDAP